MILDVYEELPSEGWSYEDSVELSFDITDTTHYYQLFINLRINAKYKWENFFIKMTIVSPSGEEKTSVEQLILAENSGKWRGSGIGDIITFQEPIQKRKTFKEKGTYKVILKQNMREDNWQNLRSIGMKIEKQEEIF